MPDEETLQELARKLIETFHLNVPERAALPDGRMPFTALVSAAGVVLSESGWLPSGWGLDRPFAGVLIEKRADGAQQVGLSVQDGPRVRFSRAVEFVRA